MNILISRAIMTGIAALFLATGTAHAEDDDKYDPGVEYDCGSPHDQVWVKHEHVASSTIRRTITIESDSFGGRYDTHNKRTPYPVIRYNMETQTLALNGKRCREKK